MYLLAKAWKLSVEVQLSGWQEGIPEMFQRDVLIIFDIPGSIGIVPVASVKMTEGIFVPPVAKLFQLEDNNNVANVN